MGVGEDFALFKDKYNIDQALITSISQRYRRITRQLNQDFWNTASEAAHSFYVGSYGRDTAARGISDLDIAFVLPYQVYAQYHAYTQNGQSALLQAVKRSIQKTYSTSESFGDGQVVVITFTDGIKFEILPTFEHTDGTGLIYPNANNGGSWKICNPRAEIKAVKLRSDATNRNLKLLCRMMRVWRDYNSVPMSGILIDTLAYQFIENHEFRDKSFFCHDYIARDFFQHVSQQNPTQLVWRAPGSASHVSRTGPFERKAATAYQASLAAIQYNDDRYAWSRRTKWREIFGPLYPAP